MPPTGLADGLEVAESPHRPWSDSANELGPRCAVRFGGLAVKTYLRIRLSDQRLNDGTPGFRDLRQLIG